MEVNMRILILFLTLTIMCSATSLPPVWTFFNGYRGAGDRVLTNGYVYAYTDDTETVLGTTYSDSTGLVPNTNPISLNALGMANVYTNQVYTYVVFNSGDVRQYTQVDLVNVSVTQPEYALSTYGSLSAFLSFIGSGTAVLVVDEADILTSDTIVPNTVSLRFTSSGVISGAYTLTIYGAIEAGAWQIFDMTSLTLAGTPICDNILVQWCGAKGDALTDDVTTIQAAIDFAYTAGGGRVEIPFTGSDYYISDTLFVKSNVELVFQNGAQLKLTSNTTEGAMISIRNDDGYLTLATNVVIRNAQLDADNYGYGQGELYGENGISSSKSSNVMVYGARIKNCKSGTNTMLSTGGKGIQFENGVSNVTVSNCYIENCTVALSTGGSQDTSEAVVNQHSNTNIHYSGITAYSCEVLIFCSQCDSPPSPTVEVCNVLIDNIKANNCGLEKYTTAEAHGIILLDRCSNVDISNVAIMNDSNYGTVGCLIRGARYSNCSLKNITFIGESNSLIACNSPLGFGVTGTFQKNILHNIFHGGTTETVFYSDSQTGNSNYAMNVITDTLVTGICSANCSTLGFMVDMTSKAGTRLFSPIANITAVTGYNTEPFDFREDVQINGFKFTYGASGQILSTDTDPLVLAIAGAVRFKAGTTSIYVSIPTDSTEVSTGELWFDTTENNVVKVK